jgi:hypothetical protein
MQRMSQSALLLVAVGTLGIVWWLCRWEPQLSRESPIPALLRSHFTQQLRLEAASLRGDKTHASLRMEPDPWGRDLCVVVTSEWICLGSCWSDGQWGTEDDVIVVVKR